MNQNPLDRLGGWLFGEEPYRAFMYKRAKKIARRFGYQIYKPQMIWQDDAEFVAARAEGERRGIIGSPDDRCYLLLESARLIREVPGDIAECGVRYGRSSLFILSGLGGGSTKNLHIFDSFEGLSTPDARDIDASGEAAWEKGELAVPEDIVRNNLSGFGDRVVLHKGWIPERFADVADCRFAMAHIDVDLYEPTRASAEFFYPRVNPGGIILCDDYGSALCPGAKRAMDEFFADKPEHLISLPTGQSLAIKV